MNKGRKNLKFHLSSINQSNSSQSGFESRVCSLYAFPTSIHTNKLFRGINEVIAYPAGLILFLFPMSWLIGSTSSKNTDFAGSVIDTAAGTLGNNGKKITSGLQGILFGKYKASSAQVPSSLAIDADSLFDDASLAEGGEAELLVKLQIELNSKTSGLESAANVVFYSKSDTSSALIRLQQLLLDRSGASILKRY